MMRRGSIGLLFVLALCAIAAPLPASTPKAEAQNTVTLKFVTLFPESSSLFRALQAWGQSVATDTNNQVHLEFHSAGRTANEATFVSDMGNGTYDGAVLTASGLHSIAP